MNGLWVVASVSEDGKEQILSSEGGSAGRTLVVPMVFIDYAMALNAFQSAKASMKTKLILIYFGSRQIVLENNVAMPAMRHS